MADLLEKLTDEKFDNLPAIPDRFEQGEPVEPSERSDVFERGREPSEIVHARESRLPATDDEPRYEISGRSYSAKELEKSGKLEELARDHANYQALQRQYAELAERQRAEAQQAAQPPAPQIRNADIAKIYDPVSQIIIQDLIKTT